MGIVFDKLRHCCPPRCPCWRTWNSDSYDLKELPRPPTLATTNGMADRRLHRLHHTPAIGPAPAPPERHG
ncbi:hypothetical protein EVAR_27804_1 [Eumeta japonica]|uniref:Uncharacterized protein n=1 Tax=Eumeta variegata TaxID=151549 RepID=A0A4C1VHN2_EUMVA|nr:hypothetical protein EVAR_27804_1 [Eumeta japonica]